MKPWSMTFFVFLGAMLVTVFACWAVWVFMLEPTSEAVRTANVLHERFENELPISPRIHASAGALFAQTSNAEECVLLETSGLVRETLEGVLPQAEGLELETSFAAKIGFRSRELFQLNVHAGGQTVDCILPTPRILVVELGIVRVLMPEGIAWDSLSEKTIHRAHRLLERGARNQLVGDQVPEQVLKTFRDRVSAILLSEHCNPVFVGREFP